MSLVHGLLTPGMQQALYNVRSRAWVRPFTVNHYTVVAPTDVYGPDTVPPPVQHLLSGDYAWFAQTSWEPTAGGQIPAVDELRLGCDWSHYQTLIHPGAQLVVDGVTCAIQQVTRLTTSRECLVVARRV